MVGETVLRCALHKIFVNRPKQINALMEQYGAASEIYRNRKECKADVAELLQKSFAKENLQWAEQELNWCARYGVETLFRDGDKYPSMLQDCIDSPLMLYYKGNANLNNQKTVSVVGTRLASAYGKECCSEIVGHLRKYNPLIVSGLAYGIDIAAHRAALDADLETVAVLPCGIDEIYPYSHRNVAAQMVKKGGIVTEFPRGEKPAKWNFVKRNRIIAAIANAVIVVESRIKGGAMITAEYACGYNRDIFAVPGRITDTNSFGCNYLIEKNVAAVYSNAYALPLALGWDDAFGVQPQLQPQLFSFDNGKKEKILLSLKFDKPTDTESICNMSGMDWGEVSMLMLELELEGKVEVAGNNGYRLRK